MEISNMSAFTSVGKIVVVMDTKQISATFQKREFVINIPDDNPKYQDNVLFEVVGEKCGILDSFQVGQEVEVSWNLKGRTWDKGDGSPMRYFNTLQCWKINATSQQQAPPAYQQAPQPSFNDTPQSETVPF